MRKIVFLCAIFMTMFGIWGAATQANATHPRFCNRHPFHPHCVTIGDFTAHFVSLVEPVGQVNGTGTMSSIGVWSVKSKGLFDISYDVCFRATKITGNGTIDTVVKLNLGATTDVNGNLSADGLLVDLLPDGTFVDPSIEIRFAGTGCEVPDTPGDVVQVTGLEF